VIALVPMDLRDSALSAQVRADLGAVEEALRDVATGVGGVLADAARHLVDAGGKRFRATIVLLASHFGEPRAPKVIPAAVAIELTHLATLYHDDVMDEAVIRRGHPSANSRWGNTVAILTGDFLFARASRLLADLGADAIRIQADTFTRLVNGQIAETVGPRPGQDPLEHYLGVVADKTASLIATAGRFGAMFGGAPAAVIRHTEAACDALGMAFQLSDDILDVASESMQSGKTPGTDLREGVRTLPVLHALRSGGSASASSDNPATSDANRLRELLSDADLTDPRLHAEALSLLRAHPAMEAARADLRRWADKAREQVMSLPDVPARAAFESLCDYVVDRTG
jgi:geranylgeranyl pyrophosphate synthase